MFKTFFISLKIDYFSAINSFLYFFEKIKFLDKLLHPLYKKSGFKIFLSFLSSILTFFSSTLKEAVYLFIIYMISNHISNNNVFENFLHVYFIFTIIGMFINTSLLIIGYKHYTNICLLSIDAKEYLLSHLLYENVNRLIIHILLLRILIPNIYCDLIFVLILPVIGFLSKIVGEMISLKYYTKAQLKITENNTLYFLILIPLLLVSVLPYFSIRIPSNWYITILIIFLLLFLYSISYLHSYHNYKKIVKEILNSRVLDKNHNFSTKDLVQIQDKDKKIATYKLNSKTGYDRFNTIFFERHKNILLNGAIQMFVFLGIIGIIGIFYTQNNQDVINKISFFFNHYLASILILMYFINRGGIITQAMFMNCDHAMLRYNFYRKEEVITSMYKKRVKIVTLINCIPTFIISVLLILYGYLFTDLTVITLCCIFFSVIILNIFFSVFYLTTYYLFQPYNKEFRVANFTYSFIHLMTCLICFLLIKMKISSEILLIGSSIVTIILIILSNYFIKNKASYTFRIK